MTCEIGQSLARCKISYVILTPPIVKNRLWRLASWSGVIWSNPMFSLRVAPVAAVYAARASRSRRGQSRWSQSHIAGLPEAMRRRVVPVSTIPDEVRIVWLPNAIV